MLKENLPHFEILPEHVAVIMDGNGRWAEKRGLDRSEGHKEGGKVFRRICDYAADLGIEYLTFYAFSTENWKRPEKEVNAIMDLFRDYLLEMQERKEENEERGYHIRFIGEKSGVPEDILELFNTVETDSDDKRKTYINIAVNYGGRREIVHSVRQIAEKIKSGELSPDDIDEDTVSSYLYTAGQPDPDLIIRPSGEYRLSNFLTWQSAYSEFWYSDVLWPDFTEADFNRALDDFQKRHRRFGGV
ncbi:MAG: isoprenyl transferase [Acutalibacteraceae bacterium]|nr:isoprenyl transferase [Oscillospiraceae bacterium]